MERRAAQIRGESVGFPYNAAVKRMKEEAGFRLLRRSRDHGGLTAIILGPTGSGKTTFMLSKLAIPLLQRREYLFWRGLEFCQWTYLPPGNVKLLLSPFQAYQWIDRKRKSEVEDLEEYGLKVSYCYDFEDFYAKAETGKLNVIYIDDRGWIEFCDFLVMRPDIEWISLFMDEIERFAPSNAEGDIWRFNLKFANLIAEFRKNFISFYCAAQDVSDVDYRVTYKMNFMVYLRNARVPRTKSMVYPGVTRRLAKNEAVVEGGGLFSKTKFEKLKKHLNLVVRMRPGGIAIEERERSFEA